MQLQLIDVGIGMLTAFFFVAVICSAGVELVSNVLQKRSKELEAVLTSMLGDTSAFKSTSVYRSLSSGAGSSAARQKRPAYLSARSFADGVVEAALLARGGAQTATELIDGLPDSPTKQRLEALHSEVGGDLTHIKAGLEGLFDDTMSRMQGAYKRWSRWALLVAGFIVAAAMNVSAVRIADTLWSDGALRSALVGAAPQIAEGPCPGGGSDCDPHEKITAALTEVDDLELPIGWGAEWDREAGALWTVLGWVPIALAATAGAPFWFDLLARLSGMRGGRGVPPRAADDAASHTNARLAGMSTGTLDRLLGATAASGMPAPAADSGADQLPPS